MCSRIFFAAIAGFWLVMNLLLWRSQSGEHSRIGSAVPVGIVWDKILTAPDNSSLDIYDHGKKIGFCQWMANAGGAARVLNQSLSRDYAPDGSMAQPGGYGLSLEGNTAIFGTNRVRFEMRLSLSTNQTWQDFRLTARMRPTVWDIHASAAARNITVKVDGDGGSWQKTVKFSEFEHPESLLEEFGGNGFAGFAGAANLPLQKDSITQTAAAMRWEAHEDWMPFGHSRVRVYRLETELFGQRLRLFASRAGEILWVEAPDQLTLRNEAFSHF
jgi:hemolysin-activating ACP:hemolysin acyltransferase